MAASPGHWSGTRLKGRGNGLLHGLTIRSSRTAYICMATAMVLLGVAFVWVSYVQSMLALTEDVLKQEGWMELSFLGGNV